MAFNKKSHLRQNLDAIKLAFVLEQEQRKATPQEREILSGYAGFGGIKAILSPAGRVEDLNSWTKSEAELFPMVAELHQILREYAGNEQEYKRYFNSLKNSVLTSFYTPKAVIDALSDTMRDKGITVSRFLEPSAGVGAFIFSFKESNPQSEIHCFEKDMLAGKILSHLYPEEKVRIEGFEKLENRFQGYFDCIASNIPFGDVAVFDPQLSQHENLAVRQSTQSIHNYFFIKSIQAVGEGGIIAFISSQGVLNSKQNRPIREYLMENCDLVSAIRLPNNLFTDHTGTEAGSDLIILQKNDGDSALTQRQQLFIGTRELSNGITINNLMQNFDRVIQTNAKVDTDPYGKPAIIFTHNGGVEGIAGDMRKMLSEDFSRHFSLSKYQSLLNKSKLKNESHISNSYQATLFDNIQDVPTSEAKGNVKPSQEESPVITLYELFGFTNQEITKSYKSANNSKRQSGKKAKKEDDFVFRDWREEMIIEANRKKARQESEQQGQQKRLGIKEEQKDFENRLKPTPYIAEDIPSHYKNGTLITDEKNRIGYLRDLEGFQPMFHPLELTDIQYAKASLYIEIRDTYHHLYHNEATRHKANPALREMLNRLYDNFTRRFGNMNEAKNLSLIKMDAGGMEILSLERYIDGKAMKADIFRKPVAFNSNEITHTDNSLEALTASLNKYNTVNLEYMAGLTDKSKDDILKELKGTVFFNPLVNAYEIKDKFISGNVIAKAEYVEQHLKKSPDNKEIKESLNALKEAIPNPIAFEDLDFNFGERWIPTGIYDAYASCLFDTNISIHYAKSRDEFSMNVEKRNIKIYQQYAVKSENRIFDGITLMKHALHNTSPDITKKVKKTIDGEVKEIRVRDTEAIQLANAKIDEIRTGFTDWLNEQSVEFQQRLADKYNRTFNCFVRPDYDGSHQQFPDLDLKGLGIKDLYKSQKDAIWMDKLNGGGIIDHEVGSGKTLIICISAYEKKRLGLVNKPVITALKANVHEIAQTFCTAYPNAKVLYPGKEDFTPAKRMRIFNEMKNNNWDAIILTHEQFGMIPQSPEIQQQILQAELDSVEENLEVLRSQGKEVSRMMEKGLVKRQQNLEAKLMVYQKVCCYKNLAIRK